MDGSDNSSSIPVNFFLKKKDIQDNVVHKNGATDTNSTTATAYIIYQNNHLTARISEVLLENATLQNEKEELEEFCDKLEKTRTCLQGYIKNEHDHAKKYKELSKLYLACNTETQKLYVPFHVVIITYMLVSFILQMSNVIAATAIACFLGGHIFFVVMIYNNTNQHIHKSTELLAELKKTEQSNVYLDDLIDNM